MTRKRSSLIVLFIIMGFVLAGAFQVMGAEAKPAQVKPAQAKPAQVKPAQVKPAQDKAVKPSGTFTFSRDNDIGSLDPQKVGGARGAVAGWVYEGLISYSVETLQPIPQLAESWTRINDTTWKFILRQGAKFQDGTPVTSADVQYSFDRIMGKFNPNFMGEAAGVWRRLIDHIETPDERTAIFYTKYPEVAFVGWIPLVFIVPKAYFEKVGDDGVEKGMMGTSTYKFVERRQGEYIKFEAHEAYWFKNPPRDYNQPPKIQTVLHRILPEEQTRIAAIKAGEIDYTGGISDPNLKELEKDKNLKVVYAARNQPIFLQFSWREATDPKTKAPNPFYDVRVRRAMNHAIDVKAVIKNYMTGREYPTTLLAKDGIGYNPKVPFYAFNPEKAKALMKEAGYGNGFDTKFLVSEVTPIIEVLAQYLRNIGVRAEVTASTPTVVRRAIAQKSAEGISFGMAAPGYDPAATWFQIFARFDGIYAMHGKNDQVEKLCDQIEKEWDDKKRGKLVDQVIQIMWNDAWVVPLWEPVVSFVLRGDRWSYKQPTKASSLFFSNVNFKKK